MKSTMGFFLKAAVLALVLSVVAFGYSHYMHSKTATLQSKCEADGKSEMAEFNARLKKEMVGPWTAYQSDPLDCDPFKLYVNSRDAEALTGIQGEIVKAYMEEQNQVAPALYGIAFLIMFIGVVPVCWYFLLARLREVAAAIRRG
jgi:arginine/lysine/ornithine decarboxylase